MNHPSSILYGVLAEFAGEEELKQAAKQIYQEGFRKVDAFSPFPIDELTEILHFPKSKIPRAVLVGAIAGASGGYFMQWWSMVIDYPYRVGGRPFHSWPMFIPITFELGILIGSLVGVITFFAVNHFPQYSHPLFRVPGFESASVDGFFLTIEATDALFTNAEAIQEKLREAGATYTVEVPL